MQTVMSEPGRTLEMGSCVNTPTAERALSDAARDNGVVIYGNNTNERYTLVMMLAEEAAARGEQVVLFDYGRSSFGLNLKRGDTEMVEESRQFVRVSSRPAAYGQATDYILNEAHGQLHARVAMSYPTNNYAYDLDDFTYDQTTRYLTAYFSEVIHGPVTGTTFILPALDAMIARRRHGNDSNALRHLLSLILRGRAKGHRFVFAAFSPDEIPNEYRNNIGTTVIGFANGAQQIKAMDRVVLYPLLAQCEIIGRGVMMMPRDVFWAFASIDSRPDYVHAMPALNLTTDAGGGQPVDYEETETEIGYLNTVNELLAEQNQEPVAARNTGKATAQKNTAKKTKSNSGGGCSAALRLSRRGYIYYMSLAQLGSAACRQKQGLPLTSSKQVNADETVDYVIGNKHINEINIWAGRNRSRYSHLTSFNVIGLAMLQMAEQHGLSKAMMFVEGVLNTEDRRRPASARNVGVALAAGGLDAQQQYDLIMAGWNAMMGITDINIANDNNDNEAIAV